MVIQQLTVLENIMNTSKATKATSQAIQVTYQSGTTAKFSSIRSASRALSGNGSDRLSTTIRRRVQSGGGVVGNNVYVQAA